METPTDTSFNLSPSISSLPSTPTCSPRPIHEPSPRSLLLYSPSPSLNGHQCPVCGMATLVSPLAVDRHLLNAHNVVDGTLVRFGEEDSEEGGKEGRELPAESSPSVYVCPKMYCPLSTRFDRASLLTHLTSAHGLDVIRFTTQDGVAWRWPDNEDRNNDGDEEDQNNYGEDGIMFASSLLSSARTSSTDPVQGQIEGAG